MDDLGVIGLSWRQGGPDALARFTLDREDEAARLVALREALGVDELVYLATCNRVELYFRLPDPATPMAPLRARAYEALTGAAPEPGEAERALRAWAGEGAAEHLFLVAAGLDSAKVGETEINGQLRRALDLAEDLELVPGRGGRLTELVEEALKLARRIRREAHLDEGHTSLAEIALDAVRARLARTGGAVLLVGLSPMNERCAKGLRDAGVPLVVANRSLDKARAFVGEGERALALSELAAAPPAVEAVVTATAAAEPVLDVCVLSALADAAPSGEPPLVVDFAVPPDADPEVARALGIERLGMDEILAAAEATRAKRLEEAAEARAAIDEALERLRRRLGDEHVAPFVSALQRRYRTVARQGAEHLVDTKLADLDEAGREAVLAFAEKLAGRFAHLPSSGLRGVSRAAGPTAVDAFLAHADRELQKEFERAARARRENGRATGVEDPGPPAADPAASRSASPGSSKDAPPDHAGPDAGAAPTA